MGPDVDSQMGLARTVLYPGHAEFLFFLHAPLLSPP
jgi:hypothetical protein